MTWAVATADQQRYVARPPAGQEIPWWYPTIKLPDGEYVPLLSSDGLDYFIAGQLFDRYLIDWVFEPLVNDWYVTTHPDDAVVA